MKARLQRCAVATIHVLHSDAADRADIEPMPSKLTKIKGRGKAIVVCIYLLIYE